MDSDQPNASLPSQDSSDETPNPQSQSHPLSLPLATLSLSLSTILSPLSTNTSNPTSTTTSFSPFTKTYLKPPSKKSITLSVLSPSPVKTPKKSNKKSSSNAPLQSLSPLLGRPPAEPSYPFGGRRCTVVWLRADLRVHDNEALSIASSESLSMLPVFLLDPRDFGRSPSSGFDRTGPFRAAFLLESVKDLRNSLRARGSDLVVRVGRPETVLPELAKSVGADGVFAHREVSRDEVKTEERVEKALEKEGIEIKYFWGSTLYHIEDLPFDLDQMPTNYGGFREKVSVLTVRKSIEVPEHLKGMPARGGVEPGEIPTLAELGVSAPPSVTQDGKPTVTSSLVGGETEALERLKKFAAECRAQPNKGDKDSVGRDSIYGANFSCKISPWLATGCLSPRFMFEELKKTATNVISAATASKSNTSSDNGMNWLMFELLWRDFFR
ncbi:blue-light photoreceptor PHR2-like protein [Carex littledalei]|uniref:Blue-light photoreceptor PHR2-like protein n=1 Tax=Carex littledalei TaxID=544730 RepID=A0A833QES9_9POAL|nr:blue-light photoreceptor PHR2-like protein [Carex littledalei]